MPALWVTSINGQIVALSDGRTFDLATVAGNGFNANRLGRINAAIQAAIDVRIPLADLPIDDPDRTVDPNRPTIYWSDADGNPSPTGTYLCSRSQRVWLTWDGVSLTPHAEEVRG